MNDVFWLWLSLSLSGSFAALALFLTKPFLKHFSKTWQYYIWLLVILRLLLPFSPESNVVNSLFRQTMRYFSAESTAKENLQETGHTVFTDTSKISGLGDHPLPKANTSATVYSFLKNHFLDLIWLAAAGFFFIRKVYGYRQFVKAVKKNSRIIPDGKPVTVLNEARIKMGIKKKIRIGMNSLVHAPMLIGIIKPMIVLPSDEIQLAELECIFRHELTHYRRMDFLYKWLVEIAVCLHWFNPLVYRIRKQINQSCELSCDEKVISQLDAPKRRTYGETLLNSIVIKSPDKTDFVSLSLNNDGKLIKERLCAIMHYRPKSKSLIFFATVFTVMFFSGTVYAGVYTAPAEYTISNQYNHADTIKDKNGPNVFEANTPKQPSTVVYEMVDVRKYEVKDWHRYIHDIKTNNTADKILACQIGMLAFDKDGNPLEIDWFPLDGDLDKAYFYLAEDDLEIASGETLDVFGGWSLNISGEDPAADEIAYVLYCDKEITFENGTVWKNPDFETWRSTYEGKKTDVELLKNYYPYVMNISTE